MLTPTRAASVLLVLTALVYLPTLEYGFVAEDLNDPERFFSEPRGVIETVHHAIAYPPRSLTGLSFDLSKVISGSAVLPWGYHLTNVLLHLLNSVLVLMLACRILSPWAAVGAVALFALHPLQVEAVAYISSRADLVMTFAILCGLWAIEGRRWWIAGVCACAAVLAKELGIVAFPLLALWAAWRGVISPSRGLVVGLAGGAMAAGAVLYVMEPSIGLDLAYTGTELTKLYAFLARIPVPIAFAIDHDWRWITPAMAVGSLVASLLLMAWACWRFASVTALAVLWVAICITPRALVPLLEGLHEHHLYLMTVGLSLCAGFWLGGPDARESTDGERVSGIPAHAL